MKTLVEYVIEKVHTEEESVWIVQDSEKDLSTEIEKWVGFNHRDWFNSSMGEIIAYRNIVIKDLKDHTNCIDFAFEFVSDKDNDPRDYENWKTFSGFSEIEELTELLIKKNEEAKNMAEFEKVQMKLAL